MLRSTLYIFLTLFASFFWSQQHYVALTLVTGNKDVTHGSTTNNSTAFFNANADNYYYKKAVALGSIIYIHPTLGELSTRRLQRLVREIIASSVIKHYFEKGLNPTTAQLEKLVLEDFKRTGIIVKYVGQTKTDVKQTKGNPLQPDLINIIIEEAKNVMNLWNKFLIYSKHLPKRLKKINEHIIDEEKRIKEKTKLYYASLNHKSIHEQPLHDAFFLHTPKTDWSDGSDMQITTKQGNEKTKELKESNAKHVIESFDVDVKQCDVMMNELLTLEPTLDENSLNFCKTCNREERHIFSIMKINMQKTLENMITRILKMRFETHLLLEKQNSITSQNKGQPYEKHLYGQEDKKEGYSGKPFSGYVENGKHNISGQKEPKVTDYEIVFGKDNELVTFSEKLIQDLGSQLGDTRPRGIEDEFNVAPYKNINKMNGTQINTSYENENREKAREQEAKESVSKEIIEKEVHAQAEENAFDLHKYMEQENAESKNIWIPQEKDEQVEQKVDMQSKQEAEKYSSENEEEIEEEIEEENEDNTKEENEEEIEEEIEEENEDNAKEENEDDTEEENEDDTEEENEENTKEENEEQIEEGNEDDTKEENEDNTKEENEYDAEPDNETVEDENEEAYDTNGFQFMSIRKGLKYYINYLEQEQCVTSQDSTVPCPDIKEIVRSVEECFKLLETAEHHVDIEIGYILQNFKKGWSGVKSILHTKDFSKETLEEIIEKLNDINRKKTQNLVSEVLNYVNVLKTYVKNLKNNISSKDDCMLEIEDVEHIQKHFTQMENNLINSRHIIDHLNVIHKTLSENKTDAFEQIKKYKDYFIKLGSALFEYMEIHVDILNKVNIMERIGKAIIYHEELKKKFFDVRKLWKKHCLEVKSLYKNKMQRFFFQFHVNANILFPSEFSLFVEYGDLLKKNNKKKKKTVNQIEKNDSANEKSKSNEKNLNNIENAVAAIEDKSNAEKEVSSDKIAYIKQLYDSNPNKMVYESAYFRYIYRSVIKKYEAMASEKDMALMFFTEYRSLDAIIDIITAHISNLRFFMKERRKKLLKIVEQTKKIAKKNAYLVDKIKVMKKLISNTTDTKKKVKGKHFFKMFIQQYRHLINMKKEDLIFIDYFEKFIKSNGFSASKWKNFLKKHKNEVQFDAELLSYDTLIM